MTPQAIAEGHAVLFHTESQMFLTRSLRHRVIMATTAALLSGSVATLMHGTATAVAANPFPVVGHTTLTNDISPNDGPDYIMGGKMTGYAQSSLMMDPGQRRAYQLTGYVSSANFGQVYTQIDVIDLDSLQVIRKAVIPDYEPSISVPGLGQWDYLSTLAPGPHPRLFFVTNGLANGKETSAFELITVDLTTMNVISAVAIQGAGNQCQYGANPVPQTCPIYGLSFDTRSGLVYLLAADQSVQLLSLAQRFSFSLVSYNPATQKVLTRVSLPAVCDGPPSSNAGAHNENIDQAPIFRSTDGKTVWTACNTASSDGQQGSEVAAVGQPAIASTGDIDKNGTTAVYPAFTGLMDAYADPGSDRLLFRATTFGGDNSLVVFDARHRAYIGVASLDKGRVGSSGTPLAPRSYGDGIDPSTGRFYHFTLDAIYLADGRRTAREGFPQASVYPADRQGRYGTRQVAVDTVTHHVFVMYGNEPFDGAPNNKIDDFYTVYQDNVPVSQDINLSSLDTNTKDIPMSADTTAIYSGHAQGFGARRFEVNPSDLSLQGQTLDFRNAGGQHDVFEALVGDTRGAGLGTDLNNGAAQATGYAVGVDSNTRGAYPDQSAPAPYPYGVIACHDSQGSTDQHSSADPGGYTTATCDLTHQEAKVISLVGGAAVSPSYNLPAPEVASAEITTDVKVDPGAKTATGTMTAIVSEAKAVVRGIVLAPGITIDSLTIDATAVAGGRSKSASATVHRVLSGVTTPAFTCGATCDQQQALDQINAALQAQFPGQFEVVMPSADSVAAQGTPHGYYAAMYKDRYEFLNDELTNLDLRPDVVGLEMIRNNTALLSGEQAREITEFGGVEVESRFGITPSNAAFIDGGVPGGPSDNPVAPVAGTTGGNGLPLATTGSPSGTGGDGNSTPSGILSRIAQSVLNGLLAFTDIHQLPLMATVWTVFMLPGYLATRRRRLERFGL